MLHVKHETMGSSVIWNNETLFCFRHQDMDHFVDSPYLIEEVMIVTRRQANEQEGAKLAHSEYDSQTYEHLSL